MSLLQKEKYAPWIMAQYYVMCSYSYETNGYNGGQNILSFNIKTSLLIIYSVFVKYLRKNGNTMRQYISSL